MKKNLEASPLSALRLAHARLLADLRDLEEAASEPAGPGDAGLVGRLTATQTHITDHFRFEEKDGYFDSIRNREPRLERAIEHLAEEHRKMAAALDAIVREAKTGKPTENFRREIKEWVASVRDHEARENKLAQDAFNQDSTAED